MEKYLDKSNIKSEKLKGKRALFLVINFVTVETRLLTFLYH